MGSHLARELKRQATDLAMLVLEQCNAVNFTVDPSLEAYGVFTLASGDELKFDYGLPKKGKHVNRKR